MSIANIVVLIRQADEVYYHKALSGAASISSTYVGCRTYRVH